MRTKGAPKKKKAKTVETRGAVKKSTKEEPQRWYDYYGPFGYDPRLGLTPWTRPGDRPIGRLDRVVTEYTQEFRKAHGPPTEPKRAVLAGGVDSLAFKAFSALSGDKQDEVMERYVMNKPLPRYKLV